jgi:hypothetical protein
MIPAIACFDHATVRLGIDLGKLVRALQKFVDTCVAPVWGTPAKLVRSRSFVKGPRESARVSQPHARRISRRQGVRQDDCGDRGSSLGAASRYATGPDSRVVYAYETADPVEEAFFRLGGFAMSDFVYPAYFEAFRRPRSTQFDYLRKIRRPFQILRGSYLIVTAVSAAANSGGVGSRFWPGVQIGRAMRIGPRGSVRVRWPRANR